MVLSVSTIASCEGQSRAALPERGVDHEIVRILADREHVFQKTQKAFLPPALAAQARARVTENERFIPSLPEPAHNR